MSVTFDPQTGWPVKPPMITRYWYVVWNAYCDSKSRIEANTQEELDAMYEKGRDCGLYGSIYEGGDRQGYDPQEMREYKKAFMKIWYSSCLLPPEEDLRLLAWAKALDPERWEEIDPERGCWKETQKKLSIIRNEKHYQTPQRSVIQQSTP